jgi:hypothetical protein
VLFLKQSTASQSVLIGPFVDDTDGATAETGLTIANTDIRLSANGGNMAAKNSGGGTHDEAGWYTITLDATDTATVGRLQLSVKVAGALAVFAEFQVLEEAIFDSLFGASAAGYQVPIWSSAGATVNLSATTIATSQAVASVSGAVGSVTGMTASDVGAIKAKTDNLPAAPASTTNITAATGIVLSGVTHTGAVIPTVSTLTGHTAQTGDAFARLGAPAGASVSADVAAVKAETATIVADTNELQTDWADGGRLDLLLDGASSAGDPWTTSLPGAYGAGTAGKIIGDNINATISSRLASAGYTAPLDAAGTRTAVGLASANLDTQLAHVPTVAEFEARTIVSANYATAAALTTVDNEIAVIDGLVDDIKAKTDSLTFTVAGNVDANIQRINDVALTGDGSATPFDVA